MHLRGMQIIKSITARELFKQYPEIKKQLWGGEFWSDGGYIGTVGDGVTAEIIRNYIETQGTHEEKESYEQMKLFEFEQPGANHAPLLAAWVPRRNLTNSCCEKLPTLPTHFYVQDLFIFSTTCNQ